MILNFFLHNIFCIQRKFGHAFFLSLHTVCRFVLYFPPCIIFFSKYEMHVKMVLFLFAFFFHARYAWMYICIVPNDVFIYLCFVKLFFYKIYCVVSFELLLYGWTVIFCPTLKSYYNIIIIIWLFCGIPMLINCHYAEIEK